MGVMGQIAIARQINKFHPNRSNHLHLEHALRPTNQPQRLVGFLVIIVRMHRHFSDTDVSIHLANFDTI